MSIDLREDYFALFGLPRRFTIDPAVLDGTYLALQSEVHPDRHAHLPDAQKRLALQWATRVNEAYRALRRPLSRARYLLELGGIDAELESNTAMPAEFLMEQMEWREAVSEARESHDVTELEALQGGLHRRASELENELVEKVDVKQDLAAAADTVRRMMFIEKLDQEIDEALAELES